MKSILIFSAIALLAHLAIGCAAAKRVNNENVLEEEEEQSQVQPRVIPHHRGRLEDN